LQDSAARWWSCMTTGFARRAANSRLASARVRAAVLFSFAVRHRIEATRFAVRAAVRLRPPPPARSPRRSEIAARPKSRAHAFESAHYLVAHSAWSTSHARSASEDSDRFGVGAFAERIRGVDILLHSGMKRYAATLTDRGDVQANFRGIRRSSAPATPSRSRSVRACEIHRHAGGDHRRQRRTHAAADNSSSVIAATNSEEASGESRVSPERCSRAGLTTSLTSIRSSFISPRRDGTT